MKKLNVIALVAISLSSLMFAENIDGTLAVDSQNQLTSLTPTSGAKIIDNSNQLSAGLEHNGKNDIQASTAPVSTAGSYLEGPFVGIEGNYITASEADSIIASGMSFGLRFGAQNIDWRTMAILEKFSNSDGDNSYLRGILQLDYFFLGMDHLMIDSFGIRPYAGLNAGMISLDTKTDNIKSLTYGAQLGATTSLTNNIDLDISYRYNLSSSDRIDHNSGLSVGINYKY